MEFKNLIILFIVSLLIIVFLILKPAFTIFCIIFGIFLFYVFLIVSDSLQYRERYEYLYDFIVRKKMFLTKEEFNVWFESHSDFYEEKINKILHNDSKYFSLLEDLKKPAHVIYETILKFDEYQES